jgi:Ca2+-binding RTX toxin-like protein
MIRALLAAVPFVTVPLAVGAPASAAAPAVMCAGLRATIVGTPGADVLTGTSGRDVIAGRGGNDVIRGRGGDDVICGGYGADKLSGGSGADRLYGGPDHLATTEEGTTERTGDRLRGGPGDDRLFPGRDRRTADDISYDALDWSTSSHPVTIDLARRRASGQGSDRFGPARAWVVGSRYGDHISGSSRADLISAGAGPDVIAGHGGDDVISADGPSRGAHPNSDHVTGGTGDDTIDASWGVDHLTGGPGDDIVSDTGNTPDVISGGSGRDLIIDNLADSSSPQALSGGRGVDRLSLLANGFAASPRTGWWNMATGRMVFTAGHDIAVTATGFERADLSTFGAGWTVRGTPGNDRVEGGSLVRITFRSLGGDDTFMGSAGNDVFAGGPGHDHSLAMGVGNDTCRSVEVIDGADCEHVLP